MGFVGQSLFADSILSLPGDLPRQVMDEFRRGFHAHEVLAPREQAMIAAQQGEQTWVDGLGQKVMSITPQAYHFWGQKLGYACWKDKKFRAEFMRDNPDVRVKSVARKTMIPVPRMKGERRKAESGKILMTNRFGGAA